MAEAGHFFEAAIVTDGGKPRLEHFIQRLTALNKAHKPQGTLLCIQSLQMFLTTNTELLLHLLNKRTDLVKQLTASLIRTIKEFSEDVDIKGAAIRALHGLVSVNRQSCSIAFEMDCIPLLQSSLGSFNNLSNIAYIGNELIEWIRQANGEKQENQLSPRCSFSLFHTKKELPPLGTKTLHRAPRQNAVCTIATNRVTPSKNNKPTAKISSSLDWKNWKQMYRQAMVLLQQTENSSDLTGKRKDALKIFEAIIVLNGKGCNLAAMHVNAGSLYFAQKKPNEAIYHYRCAIDIQPNFWKAQFNLGLVLVHENHLLEAKKRFQIANGIQPGHEQTRECLKAIDVQLEKEGREVHGKSFELRTFERDLLEGLRTVDLHTRPKDVQAPRLLPSIAYDRAKTTDVPLAHIRVDGWKGDLALLVHRAFVYAALFDIDLQTVFRKEVSKNTLHLPIEKFETILATHLKLKVTEPQRTAMHKLFPDNKIWFAVFLPSRETTETIKEVVEHGAKWSSFFPASMLKDKIGEGIWQFLDQPLRAYLSSISSSQRNFEKYFPGFMRERLFSLEAVLNSDLNDEALSNVGMNSLNERDLFRKVFSYCRENHRRAAARCVLIFLRRCRCLKNYDVLRDYLHALYVHKQNEAARTVQQFFRYVNMNIQLRKYRELRTLVIVRQMLNECISTIERRDLERLHIQASDAVFPLRTEFRPQATHAAALVQNLHRMRQLEILAIDEW